MEFAKKLIRPIGIASTLFVATGCHAHLERKVSQENNPPKQNSKINSSDGTGTLYEGIHFDILCGTIVKFFSSFTQDQEIKDNSANSGVAGISIEAQQTSVKKIPCYGNLIHNKPSALNNPKSEPPDLEEIGVQISKRLSCYQGNLLEKDSFGKTKEIPCDGGIGLGPFKVKIKQLIPMND